MGSEAHSGNLGSLQSGKFRESDGLIPRFLSDLFSSLCKRREEAEKAILQSGDCAPGGVSSLVDFKISASFLEVYGDDIYDLLEEERTSLKIREGSNKDTIVVGLREQVVSSADEAMGVLNKGTMHRTTGETLMNFTSSRSHAVFTVNLHQITRNDEGDDTMTTSRFTFVDLAGSERMKKTGAQGERAREGIKINEGLLALGNVINALADEERLSRGERVHVPYRQTKLTRLLQDALGGNSQTLFLACVSPSDTNASETLSTLHYANRARNIKNAPTRNVDATKEELQRLRALANLLKCELIKHKFDSSAEASTAALGEVNDELLLRDDVATYLNVIDEKVEEISGVSYRHFSDGEQAPLSGAIAVNQAALTFNNPPTTNQPRPDETVLAHDRTVSCAVDDEMPDREVTPDDDLEVVDALLDSSEEQITKIDGDIVLEEKRLLKLRENIREYQGMEKRFEEKVQEVEKLEAEKQALMARLEQANTDPSSSASTHAINQQLEKVKTSLSKARLEIRHHQQKYRESEAEAKKCKGLERRIDEMKSQKAALIRKTKDDAQRQKEFKTTKNREIQNLRKRERAAVNKCTKLETGETTVGVRVWCVISTSLSKHSKLIRCPAECSRLKTNLQRYETRHKKLLDKLNRTELALKTVTAKQRRSGVATSNGVRQRTGSDSDGFAPMGPELDRVVFVLDNTVHEKVEMSITAALYARRTTDLNEAMHAMEEEVKILNERKRKADAIDGTTPDDVLDDIIEHEDNVQSCLIRIELVENELDDLRARHPFLEDGSFNLPEKDELFDESDHALQMISKFDRPTLRTLLVSCLSTCYSCELSRRNMKESLAKKDSQLNDCESQLQVLQEKVSVLSKALEQKSIHEAASLETINSLRDDIEDGKSELKNLQAENASLQVDLEDAQLNKDKLASQGHQIQELQLLVKTLESDLEKACEALSNSHEENVRRTQEEDDSAAALRIELEVTRKALSSSRAMRDEVEEELKILKRESAVEESLNESHDSSQESNSSMHKELEKLRVSRERLNQLTKQDGPGMDLKTPIYPEREAMEGVAARTSANVPTFTKFDNLKQKYLKKANKHC